MGQHSTIHICCTVLVHYLPVANFFVQYIQTGCCNNLYLGFGEQDSSYGPVYDILASVDDLKIFKTFKENDRWFLNVGYMQISKHRQKYLFEDGNIGSSTFYEKSTFAVSLFPSNCHKKSARYSSRLEFGDRQNARKHCFDLKSWFAYFFTRFIKYYFVSHLWKKGPQNNFSKCKKKLILNYIFGLVISNSSDAYLES